MDQACLDAVREQWLWLLPQALAGESPADESEADPFRTALLAAGKKDPLAASGQAYLSSECIAGCLYHGVHCMCCVVCVTV